MRTIHCIILGLLLFWTATAFTQTLPARDVINAVQNEQIKQLRQRTDKNEIDITMAMAKIDNLAGSIDRFTGLGIGIGATLTMLQTILVVITYRRK